MYEIGKGENRVTTKIFMKICIGCNILKVSEIQIIQNSNKNLNK